MKIPYRNKLQEGIRQVALKQIRRVEEKWRKKVREILNKFDTPFTGKTCECVNCRAYRELEELLK